MLLTVHLWRYLFSLREIKRNILLRYFSEKNSPTEVRPHAHPKYNPHICFPLIQQFASTAQTDQTTDELAHPCLTQLVRQGQSCNYWLRWENITWRMWRSLRGIVPQFLWSYKSSGIQSNILFWILDRNCEENKLRCLFWTYSLVIFVFCYWVMFFF